MNQQDEIKKLTELLNRATAINAELVSINEKLFALLPKGNQSFNAKMIRFNTIQNTARQPAQLSNNTVKNRLQLEKTLFNQVAGF